MDSFKERRSISFPPMESRYARLVSIGLSRQDKVLDDEGTIPCRPLPTAWCRLRAMIVRFR